MRLSAVESDRCGRQRIPYVEEDAEVFQLGAVDGKESKSENR